MLYQPLKRSPESIQTIFLGAIFSILFVWTLLHLYHRITEPMEIYRDRGSSKNMDTPSSQFYSTRSADSVFTLNFYRRLGNSVISPWHDIPLVAQTETVKADGAMTSISTKSLLHVVCEIPRDTNLKYEVNTRVDWNPIMADTEERCDSVTLICERFTRVVEYGDYLFNYGMIPQTYSDPTQLSYRSGIMGDGDPLDMIEMGKNPMKTGQVTIVKVLGAISLVDNEQMDWKILVLQIDDPLSKLVNSLADVEVHIPGALAALRTFFTNYKPGVVNTFATMSPVTVADSSSIGNTYITRRNTDVEVIDIQSSLALGAVEALAVVSEAHLYWQQMRDKLDHDIL